MCFKKKSLQRFVSIVFNSGFIDNHGRYAREDSSASDDGGDSQSTVFIIGSGEYLTQTPVVTTQMQTPTSVVTVTSVPLLNNSLASSQSNNSIASNLNSFSNLTSSYSVSALPTSTISSERLVTFADAQFMRHIFWSFSFIFNTFLRQINCPLYMFHRWILFSLPFDSISISTLFFSLDFWSNLTMVKEENRQSSLSLSQDKVAPLPRNRKAAFASSGTIANRTTPMPPPRRANSQQRFVLSFLFFFSFFGFDYFFHPFHLCLMPQFLYILILNFYF